MLICDDFKLDSACLSQLLHSVSQCVKLAKLALVFNNIHESVSLQPLIDLLSTMTGLSHLKFTVDDDSLAKTTYFEQKTFPSLISLHLDLPLTKIVFPLTYSFTCFELSRSNNGDSLQLDGPNKNYYVSGRGVDVFPDEKLDKLVDLTLHQGSNSSGIVRGETEIAVFPSCLFAVKLSF